MNIFTKLTRQLYPTGRAWRLKIETLFYKVHDALAISEEACYNASNILYSAILPDNSDFTTTDADNWEKALGLLNQPYLALSERKTIILRKMQHPGSIKARQHYLYLEGQLRKAGFDVYVHENRFGSPPSVVNPSAPIYGAINYGQLNYGISGLNYSIIANYIRQDLDDGFIIGNDINLRSTFFIGGQIFDNMASVPLNRKNEFRELILKLKPAQTVGFLLINYI